MSSDYAADARTAPPLRDGRLLSVADVREDLRRAILGGAWRPGQPISQVQLATALGIGRGKLREALRMLQEEGLVEGKEFHRLRVATFSVDDLDSMYALRIVTETVGAAMTVPRLTAVDKLQLTDMANQLRTSRRSVDEEEWNGIHDRFHDVVAGRTRGPIADQMKSFSARSDRYRRMYFEAVEKGLAARPAEHEHKRLAVNAIAGDVRGTTVMLAKHYGRTASSILQMMAPEETLRAVPAALSILDVDLDVDVVLGIHHRTGRQVGFDT